MKKLITTLCIIAITLTGCTDAFKTIFPKQKKTAVSVIGDGTDSLIKIPTAAEILPLYPLDDNHLYNGFALRVKNIEDVSLNDVYSYNLEPASALMSNSGDRLAGLKTFRDRVKETFDQAKVKYTKTEAHTQVYRSLISEADYLAHTDADDKYLVIYSNLLDHCDYLDLYNLVTQDLVVNHPDAVMESLTKMFPIANLKGVKVLIIYQASSYHDEKLFLIASNFYRRLLVEHGAEVEIVPGLVSNKRSI